MEIPIENNVKSNKRPAEWLISEEVPLKKDKPTIFNNEPEKITIKEEKQMPIEEVLIKKENEDYYDTYPEEQNDVYFSSFIEENPLNTEPKTGQELLPGKIKIKKVSTIFKQRKDGLSKKKRKKKSKKSDKLRKDVTISKEIEVQEKIQEPPRVKKERRMLSLQTKLTILKRLENGEKPSRLARVYCLNNSTIRTIKQNAEKIQNSVVQSTSIAAKVTTRSRNPILEKVEKMLAIWMENQNKKISEINYSIAREKALMLYDNLKQLEKNPDAVETFIASKGWYEKFKKRQNFHNVKFKGEETTDGTIFPDEFKAILAAGGYKPNQVFNVDETNLFWKRMPEKTYISKEEKTAPGFKAAKDKLTVLLCSNAEGDFKCKPLVVYHSQMPRALKNVKLKTLPVHWKSSKTGLINTEIFEEWFANGFCKEVGTYCREKNIPFKILLLLDNASSHPKHLNDLNSNVRVIFLPPSTSSFIQPLDQGVMHMFKMYYVKWTLNQVVSDMGDRFSAQECWRKYNILQAMNNIKKAWDEVKKISLNSVWEALWSESVKDFEGFVDLSSEIAEIVRLGRTIGGDGFDDLDESDIVELLQSHEQPTDIKDVPVVETEPKKSKNVIVEFDSGRPREITVERLSELFKLAELLEKKAVAMDPDKERSALFKKNLTAALVPYREIYNEMVKLEKERNEQNEVPAGS